MRWRQFDGQLKYLITWCEYRCPVDETDMPRMHISTYSLAETFDVGIDYGTQVDPGYEGSPFAFTGDLDRVTITLTD